MKKLILALMIFMLTAQAALAGTDLVLPVCNRFVRVYIPDGIGPNAPLLEALHPGLSNAQKWETTSGFNAYADSNKFIIVYPFGYQPPPLFAVEEWNAGWCCGPAFTTQSNDIAFLREVIQYMGEHFSIDKSKVYLGGYSNGAMLAMRYLCEYPEDVKGAVVMAASLTMNHASCTKAINKPVTWGYGDADTNVPPAGGIGIGGNFFPSIANTVAFFTGKGVTFTMLEMAGVDHTYASISAGLTAQYSTSQAKLIGDMIGTASVPAKTYYYDVAQLHPYFSDPGNTKPYQYGP